MKISIYILSFFAGSLFSSYFYTLYKRFSAENPASLKQILTKPSNCPHCSKRIQPVFLIPLFGYLITLARCRHCHKNIDPFYFFAEILAGLFFAVVVHFYGYSAKSVIVSISTLTVICISFIDVRKMIIPDFLNLLFFIIAAVNVIIFKNYFDHLWGLILMMSIFLIVMIVFPGGMGGGDLKLASSIGLFLGLKSSIVAFEVAVIAGAIFGIIYGIVSKKGLKTKISFGPFLAMGFLVSLFWGEWILFYYYNIFS